MLSSRIMRNSLDLNVLFIDRHHMSPEARKLVFGVSDQLQHNPACAATEDVLRLEILDLESRGIVPSM